MDFVYHAALYELEEAAAERGNEDQAEVLQTLVSGTNLLDSLLTFPASEKEFLDRLLDYG